jgi:hypothetical protein
MLPRFREALLKPSIELYNNMAKSGDCAGRLYAELQVQPSPRISWEFESLGDSACEPEMENQKLEHPLVGHWFSIDEPYISGQSWGTTVGQPRASLRGSAAQACYGDWSSQAHSLKFFLPNARFQEVNVVGQGQLEKYFRAKLEGRSRDIKLGSAGRFITASIDDTWNIHLETRQEALDWLASKQNNVGTLITTIGRLYHPKVSEDEAVEISKAPSLTMDEALDRLDTLSFLLSFANGGYLGPLYVEAFQKGEKAKFSAAVLAYRTTPLEQIGPSWLTIESDFGMYIQCFSVLDRMKRSTAWKESLDLILLWYFQAIQPQSAQIRGQPWPIVANALGAALERLSVTILKEDLGLQRLGNLKTKTTCLLEKIGLTRTRGFDDMDRVDTFVTIRNEATHPRPRGIAWRERERTLQQATQWVEEALLWRLGYGGQYHDRLRRHYASTEPRYDLTARDANW